MEVDDSPLCQEESLCSTKKVRIRPAGKEGKDDGMGKEADTLMTEKEPGNGTSYKNKLLNLDGEGTTVQARKEVVLSDQDFQIGRTGDIPSIDFSREIKDLLARGMERTLIIKLLGRSITYHDLLRKTQALWQLKGSFHLIDMEGGFFMATFDLAEDYMKKLTGAHGWCLVHT
ncbi:hypothetical protein K1719_024160 [Acacia pycnantha]|nr:hypothetical protein K1719_024160 [Acacia pycnantha]